MNRSQLCDHLVAQAPYLPLGDRPRLMRPTGARVALWVVTNIEFREYLPHPDANREPWPRMPHPDVQQYSFHDYGNRVGLWRLLTVLDEHHVRCTASLNYTILSRFPEIVDAINDRSWEVMFHGLYNTRYLYGMSVEAERELYESARRLHDEHFSAPLRGLLGPSLSASPHTIEIAAASGLSYHANWALDDQPAPVRVPEGRMVAMPYSFELNDASLFRTHVEIDEYVEMCRAQFDQLYDEGEASGRVMCLPIHAYLMGQPHRVRAFGRLLAYILSHDRVWQATGAEIAAHFLDHYHDQFLAHAESLKEADVSDP